MMKCKASSIGHISPYPFATADSAHFGNKLLWSFSTHGKQITINESENGKQPQRPVEQLRNGLGKFVKSS